MDWKKDWIEYISTVERIEDSLRDDTDDTADSPLPKNIEEGQEGKYPEVERARELELIDSMKNMYIWEGYGDILVDHSGDEKLFQIKLTNKRIVSWKPLKQHCNDCVPNVMSFFGLLPPQLAAIKACEFPHGFNRQNWLILFKEVERIQPIVHDVGGRLVRASYDYNLHQIYNFDAFNNIFDNMLNINYMCVMGIERENTFGHAIILAKDNDGTPVLLDPQPNKTYIGVEAISIWWRNNNITVVNFATRTFNPQQPMDLS